METSEADASRFLDKMLHQYQQKAVNSSAAAAEVDDLEDELAQATAHGGPSGRPSRRPPAIV